MGQGAVYAPSSNSAPASRAGVPRLRAWSEARLRG